MNKEKVVLAYSGGLDTSVILKWLLEKNYEVIAYIADIGQDEDMQAAKEKALKIGASKVYVEDMKEEFVTDYIYPAFKANALYEGRYLLGTSIARPLIAKRQVEIAAKEGAQYIAHGATGKGNDQVRFELSAYALKPDIKVISPWKTAEFLAQFKGRPDMLAYAEKHGVPVKATAKKPYSEDDNLLHMSHEGGILEDPNAVCAEEVYSRTASIASAPAQADIVSVTFKGGIPVKVDCNGRSETKPLALFMFLNELGSKHGIGRLDMVENRFVGIKSRGVYETPGGTILHNAHRDIEGLVMDREVMKIRDMLSLKVAELAYNGFWFAPEFEFLMECIDNSQKGIDGTVQVQLLKGVAYPVARSSPVSLYDPKMSSFDEEGGYNQQDAEGFIKINAVRLKNYTLSKMASAKKQSKAA